MEQATLPPVGTISVARSDASRYAPLDTPTAGPVAGSVAKAAEKEARVQAEAEAAAAKAAAEEARLQAEAEVTFFHKSTKGSTLNWSELSHTDVAELTRERKSDWLRQIRSSGPRRMLKAWCCMKPFLFGFLGCLLVVVIPINSGNNINFWRYALLQQGLWAAYSVAIFECCFNAALPLHSMPVRLLLMGIAFIVYVEAYLIAAGMGKQTTLAFKDYAPTYTFWPLLAFYGYGAFLHEKTWLSLDDAARLDNGEQSRGLEMGNNVVAQEAVGGSGQEGLLATPAMIALPDVHASLFGVRRTKEEGQQQERPQKIRRRPLAQLFLVTCYVCMMQIMFFSLTYFKDEFAKFSGSSGDGNASDTLRQTMWFFAFWAVNTIEKTVVLRIGLMIDAGKKGEISFYLFGELMACMYYFSFYRILFESISAWWVFGILQVLHLTGEWFLYPFRTSQWFRVHLFPRVPSALKLILMPLVEIKASWREFAVYRSCLFGIRVVVTMYSAVAIYILQCVVWEVNDGAEYMVYTTHPKEWKYLGIYFLVAVTMEILNFAATQVLFYRPNELTVFDFLPSVLSGGGGRSEFPVMASLIIACLLNNVTVLDVRTSYYKDVHSKAARISAIPVGIVNLLLAITLFVAYRRWVLIKTSKPIIEDKT